MKLRRPLRSGGLRDELILPAARGRMTFVAAEDAIQLPSLSDEEATSVVLYMGLACTMRASERAGAVCTEDLRRTTH